VIGARLGPYEVLAKLGEGGMGEVYRARDARLGREVALKILPDEVASDPERLVRFEREAQVLASLNHPHIAAIYGLEAGSAGAGVTRALVLELVDGETLAEVIARGPVPPDDAVRLARQMADAVEAAHEQGIIHRDLKPANIKVTSTGAVKVLDFGLAKLDTTAGTIAGGSSSVSMSPTMTSPAMLTGETVLLGTASYMAPEQARGKPVDKRADIWAFGVVLYEMLSGARAFGGESVTEVAGAVIHKEPDWSALPGSIPPALRMIVGRCLQKDLRQRFRDMGDVRLALDGAFATETAPRDVPDAPRRRRPWAAASLAVIAILVAVVAVLATWQGGVATRPALVRFEIPALPNRLTVFTLSPDGRHLGMLASDAEGRSSVWVHSFESGQTRELQRAGNIGSMPFWSPDGRFLAYGRPDGVYRIDIAGGPPERIAASAFRVTHGAWSPSGALVVGGRSGLMQLPAGGGEIVPLTALDDSRQEFLHAGPSFLPDGRRFLYMRFSKDPARSGVYVGSLDAPPDEQPAARVMAAEGIPLFAASANRERGHVLFMRDRALMAQAFDVDSLQLAGEPVLVADNVEVQNGSGVFSASTNGVLAFKHSEEFMVGGTPVWVDQDGTELGVAVPSAPSDTVYPQISADGTRVALVVDNNVWVHYLDGRPPIKLTFQGGAFSPAWSPDGRRLAFELSGRVHVLPSDGSGSAPEPLTSDGHVHPNGWTKDGRVVVSFETGSQGTGWDVGQVPASGGGSIEPIVQTPASEGLTGAALSPGGQWLAYVSNATGTDEIWVRPYAGSGAPVRVSAEGGAMPVWARNGRELYFITATPEATWRVMGARLEPGSALRFSSPRQMFETSYALGGQPPSYDVAADGRFLMLRRDRSRPAEPTHVVLNWQSLVERAD
jgi:Tol biopolymer transport system component